MTINLPPPSPRQRLTPLLRVEHEDPRVRLLMLYGVWVKCLPHQVGKRALVESCIARCKAQIAARPGVTEPSDRTEAGR